MSAPATPTPRVVLALSGGGVKAAAHLGVARALAEAGVRPVGYAGTSMGAVVAAALAAGAEPDTLVERFAVVAVRGVARDPLAPVRGLFGRSLLRPEALRRAIEAFVGAGHFHQLVAPLTVTATDLDSGELLLYGAGGRDAPLIDALLASCALPLYFPPVTLDGHRAGDGGLRCVIPLAPALAAARELSAGLVVAVDVGPGFDGTGGDVPSLPPMVRAHDDAVGILMASSTRDQVALWRADPARPPLLYVRPPVERYATFRVERSRAYAEAGYAAGRESLASLAGS